MRLNTFGHSHSDQAKVVMSNSDPQKAVGIYSICGSITTWGGNPSFCVYEVDAETMLPI